MELSAAAWAVADLGLDDMLDAGQVVVQAPAPARATSGGMASTALLAHVAVAKFAWHLPLYRQTQMFAGQGIDLDRATLTNWVGRVAWWLRPLYERLLGHIRSHDYVFCDETPLRRLDPGRGKTKVCQIWSQAVDHRPWRGPSPPAAGYVYAEGRRASEVTTQLAAFSGVLHVDGYAAYKSLAKARRTGKPIRLVFCLAHARRASSCRCSRRPSPRPRRRSSPGSGRSMRSRRASTVCRPQIDAQSAKPKPDRS
ncbi:MAG: hypothetical protein E5V60_01340 [Mesorhizobium sp.]|nr:MAG: hypothetical protein E5V60_01340 [Mesorhizobium sp.]